jgi:hypothetical protein
MSGYEIYRLTRTWLTLLAMLLCASSYAQNLSNQTSIFIPEGMEVHLGDVNSSGFIQNQGTLHLSGNWQNTNVYQGLGTLWLTGDSEQVIFNNRNAVTDLVIDGGGVKTIRGMLPVSGHINFLHGLVDVQEGDTLYLTQNATVTGGSFLSYVQGPLTVEGTGYRFFPIGSGGGYYPVELLNISGIQPVNELRVITGLPDMKLPAGASVYSDVYWSRKTISGTFERSPLALSYAIDDDYAANHQVALFQGATLGELFNMMGDATITGSEGINKITSGSDLTGRFFLVGGVVPLPPGGVEGKYYMSTSLSPRASNVDNQYVRIFGDQLSEESFHFMVYNRWGLMIYENRSLSSMMTRGWDGRHKGEYLPAGAYPYVVKARTKQGELFEVKGVISIVN